MPKESHKVSRQLLFGGRNGASSRVGAGTGRDPLAPLLGELSWKYVKKKEEFAPYVFPGPDDREAWREDIVGWASRVWFHQNEMPEGEDLRSFDLLTLQRPFRAYIEEFGASLFNRGTTVEEIWAGQQLYDASPMWLMLSDRFEDLATERIEIKRISNSEILVWVLAAMCFALQVREPGINVMVTGGKSGHTLRITGINGIEFRHPRGPLVKPGWFSFHDPWPARSLLVREAQYRGVTVLEDVTRPPYWLISPHDISKIIVGYLISIDMLPLLSASFRLLDAHLMPGPGKKRPLWNEDPEKPDLLFPVLFAAARGLSPTTPDGLSGLGKFYHLQGDFRTVLSAGAPAAGDRRP